MVSTPAAVGDVVYLSKMLAQMSFYGVVTSGDVPDQFAASMELMGDAGVVTMPVLVGAPGPAGEPCFALRFQADTTINNLAALPKTLTNTEADRGKYFILDDLDTNGQIIGSSAYVWYGLAWKRIQMGTTGPPGPIPIITPSVELIAPGTTSTVETGGSSCQPSWHLKLAVPQGPPGPPTTIASAPDTDFVTRPPKAGDVLGFLGNYTVTGDPVWVPVSISALIPSPYSVPQSSFTSFQGISQQAPIGSFAIPPQAFPWTPIVWGHFAIRGMELTATPMTVGAEVLLGSPKTGTLVSRGFGTTMGEVNLNPHYSTPVHPTAAISPGNGRAVVPANHTNPAQGTIYVNLWNDGAMGTYHFNPKNAQLFVMVVPIEV